MRYMTQRDQRCNRESARKETLTNKQKYQISRNTPEPKYYWFPIDVKFIKLNELIGSSLLWLKQISIQKYKSQT